MAKYLKFLFSFLVALSFIGCATCSDKIIVTSYPSFDVPQYDTNATIDIIAKRQGDDIILSREEFSKVVAKLTEMKYHIRLIQEAAAVYNNGLKTIERVSNDISGRAREISK